MKKNLNMFSIQHKKIFFLPLESKTTMDIYEEQGYVVLDSISYRTLDGIILTMILAHKNGCTHLIQHGLAPMSIWHMITIGSPATSGAIKADMSIVYVCFECGKLFKHDREKSITTVLHTNAVRIAGTCYGPIILLRDGILYHYKDIDSHDFATGANYHFATVKKIRYFKNYNIAMFSFEEKHNILIFITKEKNMYKSTWPPDGKVYELDPYAVRTALDTGFAYDNVISKLSQAMKLVKSTEKCYVKGPKLYNGKKIINKIFPGTEIDQNINLIGLKLSYRWKQSEDNPSVVLAKFM